MAPKRLQHKDYTVAWICALPLELAAAKTMLEETHAPLPQLPSDHNSYTLGRISGHNVILVCLPSGVYGTISAATVVSQMTSTFPSIPFGLMVGIGGGVPGGNDASSAPDIRLGDVVVSMPTATSGGVIQYDYGKALAHGLFQNTASSNRPPQVLLSAVSQMRSNHMVKRSEFRATVTSILDNHQSMREHFSRPERDLLFAAGYIHPTQERDCSHCDARHLIARTPRAPRASAEPQIHYGLIASGNRVIKDAQTRDILAHELGGVLCFEMEGAGLMDQLPSIVIRGICDYCDSHKQKDWQGYAALCAAAYAKVLLSLVAARTAPAAGAGWAQDHNQEVIHGNSGERNSSFNNSGSGIQYNAIGGTHTINTGRGNQFVGNFSGPVSFN
ncbi:nucleoside phosphorylase domain-containing protein [Aspergillus heterothallicus]